MVFETTDLLAIMIALVGSGAVIILTIREHGRLHRENVRLRKQIIEMEFRAIRHEG